MIRIILFLITVAVLVAGSVWLADRPGAVTINWQGWRIDTSVPVLLLAALTVLAVLGGLAKVLGFIISLPRRISLARQVSRRRKGYLALVDGLAAVAAGNIQAARRNARRADALLQDPPLTLLLSAQAAELSGDSADAKRNFQAMLDRPETAFAGLRGLLTQALKDGDSAAALDYARRAHQLNPEADWLTVTLFDLQCRAGLWKEAHETLLAAQRHGVLAGGDARRKRAVVLNERAGAALGQSHLSEAMKLSKLAREADPAFTAGAVRHAELLVQTGKPRKAAPALRASWAMEPHPDLLRAYLALEPGENPQARLSRVEKLAAERPHHPDSHLAVAEQAMAASRWADARKHLLAAAEERPSGGVFRMLAAVEQSDGKGPDVVRQWLTKAAEAPADPHWQCRQCGRPQPSWSALCPSCNAFDSLVWGVPTTPVPPSMPATAMVGQSVAAPPPLPVESSPVPEGGPAVIAVESGGETRQTAS